MAGETMATYTKLRSGEWGIRSTAKIESGQMVTVTKRDGDTKTERVARVVWSGGGVWLATIGASAPAGRNSPAGRRNGHRCRNGHAPHPGPCCTGRHRGGDDCGCDCCDMD